ncbi:MAG: NADP-dependent glyceraldehyde-3-phosphate dehydrogenase [Bradymonadales bacterium]|nr:NADP-dependent glyceraldehyde-3-phosphate dehydrogenase [Bradymonadales bacterium]
MNRTEQIQNLFPKESELPSAVRLEGRIDQSRYLVGGTLRSWDGPFEEVLSPVCLRAEDGSASQAVLGAYPKLTEKEALEALQAAVQAYDNGQGLWPTMSVADRIRHVQQFTMLMKEKREEVVKLLMWEIGKSHTDSTKEFDRTIEYIQDTIDALKELDRVGSRFQLAQGIIGQIRRAPLGVVLCMGPFNYPLNETFTTLIPALIMGNTVVFKPPKLGVLLLEPLLEAFAESFPPGVVNTVYGEGQVVVGPMMTSGKIDVLAFIGSSRVADILKAQHPRPHRLRCVLGLEAKNPAIVLPDADLELAVSECLLGALSYNGQRCTGLKILWVHDSLVEEFLRRLSAAASDLPFGMPWDPNVKLTPLPEPGKPAWLSQLVEEAVSGGARVVNPDGGTVNQTFFYPAVVYPVRPGMKLWNVEQFGPVIPVVSYRDLEEPEQYVVQSNYGQQVSLFGRDPKQLARLIDPLVNQVCRLNLNSQCQRGPDSFPFTGRKDSAEGTLSVSDALRVFTIRTLVAAKENDLNKRIITTITRDRLSSFLSTDFIF